MHLEINIKWTKYDDRVGGAQGYIEGRGQGSGGWC